MVCNDSIEVFLKTYFKTLDLTWPVYWKFSQHWTFYDILNMANLRFYRETITMRYLQWIQLNAAKCFHFLGGLEKVIRRVSSSGPELLFFSLQVAKPEKHGSGTDSDYDNTQTYEHSLRSDCWLLYFIYLFSSNKRYIWDFINKYLHFVLWDNHYAVAKCSVFIYLASVAAVRKKVVAILRREGVVAGRQESQIPLYRAQKMSSWRLSRWRRTSRSCSGLRRSSNMTGGWETLQRWSGTGVCFYRQNYWWCSWFWLADWFFTINQHIEKPHDYVTSELFLYSLLFMLDF